MPSHNSPRLLIGIMSMLRERDRRDAMRSTWLRPGLTEPDITSRFVLGRTNASDAEHEQQEHSDLVVLSCEENQHRGKTLLWFQHALSLHGAHTEAALPFTHFAEMDLDVLLWPGELQAQMAEWATTGFYGGWPVDVYRRYWTEDRFVFTNGGFAVLSRDLPVDPTGNYDSIVGIEKFDDTLTFAGGVNLPKIIVCRGTDGNP